MNKLNLKLTGSVNLGQTQVLANGTPLVFKKNEFRNITSVYETAESKVKIEVVRFLDVGGFVWFITQLFFFVISIFGLLDIHAKPVCVASNFEIEVDLKQDCNLTLKFGSPKDGAKVAEIEADCEVNEIANAFVIDEGVKKKFKALKIAKIFLALAIIITTILLIVLI